VEPTTRLRLLTRSPRLQSWVLAILAITFVCVWFWAATVYDHDAPGGESRQQDKTNPGGSAT
jgi:hypothetical protein